MELLGRAGTDQTQERRAGKPQRPHLSGSRLCDHIARNRSHRNWRRQVKRPLQFWHLGRSAFDPVGRAGARDGEIARRRRHDDLCRAGLAATCCRSQRGRRRSNHGAKIPVEPAHRFDLGQHRAERRDDGHAPIGDDSRDCRKPNRFRRGNQAIKTGKADAGGEKASPQNRPLKPHRCDLGPKTKPAKINTDPPRDKIAIAHRPHRHIFEDQMAAVRLGNSICGIHAFVGKVRADRGFCQRPAGQPGHKNARSDDDNPNPQPMPGTR